jgi:cobalamin biosynthesis protein CobD/CbiB
MSSIRNNELQVVSRKLTKEDDEEICKAIAEYNNHALSDAMTAASAFS